LEIDHPGARPVTPQEQALLELFRQRLHERVITGGLSVDDVRRIVAAIRSHPHASVELMRAIGEEARQQLPGGQLISFEWE
jgi:hypothetical protein